MEKSKEHLERKTPKQATTDELILIQEWLELMNARAEQVRAGEIEPTDKIVPFPEVSASEQAIKAWRNAQVVSEVEGDEYLNNHLPVPESWMSQAPRLAWQQDLALLDYKSSLDRTPYVKLSDKEQAEIARRSNRGRSRKKKN